MQEVDDNLDLMSSGLGRLKNLATDLNEEIESQNDLLDRINDKVMDTDDSLWHQQKQIKRILK
jgi:synaptosomal-associated protein 29